MVGYAAGGANHCRRKHNNFDVGQGWVQISVLVSLSVKQIVHLTPCKSKGVFMFVLNCSSACHAPLSDEQPRPLKRWATFECSKHENIAFENFGNRTICRIFECDVFVCDARRKNIENCWTADVKGATIELNIANWWNATNQWKCFILPMWKLMKIVHHCDARRRTLIMWLSKHLKMMGFYHPIKTLHFTLVETNHSYSMTFILITMKIYHSYK